MPYKALFDRLVTSHVGSFPLEYSIENVKRIISDLAEIGIDVPPYPQLRDFIEIYIHPLASVNLVFKEGKYYKAKVSALLESKPPTISIGEVEHSRNYLNKYNFLLWRAPVTGVFTIASKIYIDDPSKSLWATAITNKELVISFFKDYVINIVKYVYNLGYRFIVLDEPMLANIVGAKRILFNYTHDELIELYEEIFKSVPEDAIKGIHVCGRVPPRLHEILCEVSSLKVLNHEFKDTPENINTIRKDLLEKYDKILSPGIVSSKTPRVESLSETKEFLEAILKKFGDRVNIISADCGFGALRGTTSSLEEAYRIGLEKLKIVVQTVQEFNKVAF